MYNPQHFAEPRREVLYDFIREYSFATVISQHEGELKASHIPLVLDAEQGTLRGHFARANAHWRTLDNAAVLVIFRGPDHYVTPNWYPSKNTDGKVVPTWNYIAVHVNGKARVSSDAEFLIRNVTDLTNHNEAAFANPWRVEDAPADYIHGLARGIVGIEMTIESIEGKWKMNQNRSEADREGVIQGLDALGTPAAIAMARAMKLRYR